MKKIKKYFLTIISAMFLITNVSAATNPYGRTQTINGITTVRCTWYAWQQAYEKMGVALPGWGNAVTWLESAKKAGYSTGVEPKKNSIAVYNGSGGYGHVAYVVSVNGDEMTTNEGGITTTKMECNEANICEEKSVAYNGDGIANGLRRPTTDSKIIGYIYLENAPKQPVNPNTPKKETTTPTVKKEPTPIKSNNANLKNIEITAGNFVFDKDKTEYQVTVPYETTTLKINGEVEDEKAKVEIIEPEELEVGKNLFTLKVTAEDETKKEYKVTVIRLEKIEPEMITVGGGQVEEKTKKNNEILFYIAITITIASFITSIISFLIIRKRKKF